MTEYTLEQVQALTAEHPENISYARAAVLQSAIDGLKDTDGLSLEAVKQVVAASLPSLEMVKNQLVQAGDFFEQVTSEQSE